MVVESRAKMNLEALLNKIQTGEREFMLTPYVTVIDEPFIAEGEYIPPRANKRVVWLQYEGPEVGEKKHRKLSAIGWQRGTEYAKIFQGGNDIMVPLALAEKVTEKDLKWQINYGRGHLWGWFPHKEVKPAPPQFKSGWTDAFLEPLCGVLPGLDLKTRITILEELVRKHGPIPKFWEGPLEKALRHK